MNEDVKTLTKNLLKLYNQKYNIDLRVLNKIESVYENNEKILNEINKIEIQRIGKNTFKYRIITEANAEQNILNCPKLLTADLDVGNQLHNAGSIRNEKIIDWEDTPITITTNDILLSQLYTNTTDHILSGILAKNIILKYESRTLTIPIINKDKFVRDIKKTFIYTNDNLDHSNLDIENLQYKIDKYKNYNILKSVLRIESTINECYIIPYYELTLHINRRNNILELETFIKDKYHIEIISYYISTIKKILHDISTRQIIIGSDKISTNNLNKLLQYKNILKKYKDITKSIQNNLLIEPFIRKIINQIQTYKI